MTMAAGANARAAEIFWASDPVKPGQTVQINGMDLDTIRKAEVRRLDDVADKTGAADEQTLSPGIQSDKTLTYVLPASLQDGVYALTLEDDKGKTVATDINSADVYWSQGDDGDTATPGGWLRVQGRNIARTASAILELRAQNGSTTRLHPDTADLWSASFTIPNQMAAGSYTGRLWNGNGDNSTWQPIGPVTIAAKRVQKGQVMELRSNPVDGPALDDTARINAALEGLANQGGGTLVLRPGIYRLSGGIRVPNGVTLKGQSRELVSLIWRDMDQPPPALIDGYKDFTIEDLTINAQRHFDVIRGGLDQQSRDWSGGNITLRNVRVRADAFFGHTSMEDVSQRISSMSKYDRDGVAGLRLGGNNISVLNCDVMSTSRAFVIIHASNVVLADNAFQNGSWYGISGSSKVIFENNIIRNIDIKAAGGGINTLGGFSYSGNVMMKNNEFSDMYGWDREAMTADGPGGFFYGKLKKISSTTAEMEGQQPGQVSNKPWTGAGFFVIGGRGTGFAAKIVRRDGNSIELDRALAEGIDENSIVTITPMQEKYLILDNKFSDVGAVQIYGTGYKHVFFGNKITRGAGILISGRWYRHPQPNFFIQILNNTIAESDIAGSALLSVYGQQFEGNTSTLSLGTVVRGNTLSDNARMRIGGNASAVPLVQAVLVEDNDISNTDIGIDVTRGVKDLTLIDNHIVGTRVAVKNLSRN